MLSAKEAVVALNNRYENVVDSIVRDEILSACREGKRYCRFEVSDTILKMKARLGNYDKNLGCKFKEIMEQNGFSVNVDFGLFCVHW